MTDSHDPIEAALEVLRSVPPPERQQQHRAAFLEEARRVSAAPLMRLEQMNGRHEERRMSNRRLRRHLLLIAILIALFVAGGVLAQEIIDFFTRSEDDTTTVEVYYSIPPERLDSIPSAATLEQLVSEADYEVQVPTYIPEPYNFTSAHYDTETQAAVIEYHCEENDGWGIQIGQLPVDQTEIVTSPVEVGASAIVESVMIGDVEGQYVRGMWVPIVGDPATIEPRPGTSVAETAVWTNDTEWQRLSWMENGIVFSVSTGRTRGRGIAPEPCALDKDDYVAIANSLQPARMLQNLPLLRSPEDTLSVDEVVAQADFDVLMPTYIPEAYTFEIASFTPVGSSSLNYRCGDVWAFRIEQRRMEPDEILDIRREVGASADIETVQIGEHAGQYVRGHWLSFLSRTEATPGTPISRPATWTNFSGWQQLVWYADGFLFKIATSGGLTNSIAFPPCTLDKDDYVAIATSLQPASELQITPIPTAVAYPAVESPHLFTRADGEETAFDVPDYNEVLPSIVTNIALVEEAETLAGYDIPEPNYLPGDFSLNRISYAGALNLVLLGYDNSAEAYSSIDVVIMPIENFRSGDAQAFFAQFDTVGWSAVVQQVPVRGRIGEFVIGWWTWNPTNAQRTQVYAATYAPGDQQPMRWVSDQDTAHRILRWEENGHVFQIRTSEALGTPFTLEQLLRVAESMQ